MYSSIFILFPSILGQISFKQFHTLPLFSMIGTPPYATSPDQNNAGATRSPVTAPRALRSSRTIGRRAATTRRPGAARGSQPFSCRGLNQADERPARLLRSVILVGIQSYLLKRYCIGPSKPTPVPPSQRALGSLGMVCYGLLARAERGAVPSSGRGRERRA